MEERPGVNNSTINALISVKWKVGGNKFKIIQFCLKFSWVFLMNLESKQCL